jgi:uncharacterized protein (DUF4415 family)
VRSEDIRDYKPSQAELKKLREIAARQARGDDSQIDYSDIPPMTPEQLASMVSLREFHKRRPVSVRIDARVIEWLKAKGPGYLTRINDILTNLMEAERAAADPGANRRR